MPVRWPAVAVSPFTETEEDLSAIASDVTALSADIATVQADAAGHVKKTGDVMSGPLTTASVLIVTKVSDPSEGGEIQLKGAGVHPNIVMDAFQALWRVQWSGTVRIQVGANQLLIRDGSTTLPSLAFISDTNTGMYLSAADAIGLATAGVRRMNLNSAGLFVDVSGSATTPSLRLNDANTGMYLSGTDAIGFATDGVRRLNLNSSGLFIDVSGSAATPAIRFNDADTGFYLIGANRIAFATAGAFRWEMTSAGEFVNVAAGSTSASNTTQRTLLGIPGGLNIFVADSAQTIIAGRNSDGGVIDFRRSGSQVGTISVTTTNTAYNTSSDRRLKKNIKNLTGTLDTIKKLRPRSYRWKVNDSPGVGLIAQEAVKVVPQMVKRPNRRNDSWGIDNSQLVPWLIGAVQELADKVETLEKKLADAT